MKYGIGSRVRLTTTLKGTFVQATITDESLKINVFAFFIFDSLPEQILVFFSEFSSVPSTGGTLSHYHYLDLNIHISS